MEALIPALHPCTISNQSQSTLQKSGVVHPNTLSSRSPPTHLLLTCIHLTLRVLWVEELDLVHEHVQCQQARERERTKHPALTFQAFLIIIHQLHRHSSPLNPSPLDQSQGQLALTNQNPTTTQSRFVISSVSMMWYGIWQRDGLCLSCGGKAAFS